MRQKGTGTEVKSTRDGSDHKPKCPDCGAPLTWLAHKLHGGRFCSAKCQKKYMDTMTRLAVDRLHATLPKTVPDSGQSKAAGVVMPANAESPAS